MRKKTRLRTNHLFDDTIAYFTWTTYRRASTILRVGVQNQTQLCKIYNEILSFLFDVVYHDKTRVVSHFISTANEGQNESRCRAFPTFFFNIRPLYIFKNLIPSPWFSKNSSFLKSLKYKSLSLWVIQNNYIITNDF